MKIVGMAVLLMTALTPVMAKALPQQRAVVAAPPLPLPIFDFLGQSTEKQTTMTDLFGNPCTSEGFELTCAAGVSNDVTIAGVRLTFIFMQYHQSKLYYLKGMTPRENFTELLSAFSSKYGNPTIETRQWQSRSGTRLDNEVAVWKFRGGNLELASIGSRVDSSDFTFSSEANQPPLPPAKVDF